VKPQYVAHAAQSVSGVGTPDMAFHRRFRPGKFPASLPVCYTSEPAFWSGVVCDPARVAVVHQRLCP
jgi:hypothetical protein